MGRLGAMGAKGCMSERDTGSCDVNLSRRTLVRARELGIGTARWVMRYACEAGEGEQWQDRVRMGLLTAERGGTKSKGGWMRSAVSGR